MQNDDKHRWPYDGTWRPKATNSVRQLQEVRPRALSAVNAHQPSASPTASASKFKNSSMLAARQRTAHKGAAAGWLAATPRALHGADDFGSTSKVTVFEVARRGFSSMQLFGKDAT
jgi:hypothetical protein